MSTPCLGNSTAVHRLRWREANKQTMQPLSEIDEKIDASEGVESVEQKVSAVENEIVCK